MPLKAARSVIIRFRCTSASSSAAAAHVAAQVLVQLVQDAPGVDRQPVAHQPGDAAQLAERVAQAGLAALGRASTSSTCVLELARSSTLVGALRRHAAAASTSTCTSADQLAARRSMLAASTSARRRCAEDADQVLGALGVAAEPEQVVGDAARQIAGARARRPTGCRSAPAASPALTGPSDEHPGVLAAAAALHRDDRRRRCALATRVRPPGITA